VSSPHAEATVKANPNAPRSTGSGPQCVFGENGRRRTGSDATP
jgi:hypothetical protein